MNLQKAGTNLKENIIQNKARLLRIASALILSNLFFFLLFGGTKSTVASVSTIGPGEVEIQIEAVLLTPFEEGKNILLIQRQKGQKVQARFHKYDFEANKASLILHEEDAAQILLSEHWEIIPFLKDIHLSSTKVKKYEIHY